MARNILKSIILFKNIKINYAFNSRQEKIPKGLSLLHRAFDSNSLFISPTYTLVNRSILMLTH